MRSAERIFARNDPEETGLCMTYLAERYKAAAMYAFTLDRNVIPYLKGELRKQARIHAAREQWGDKAKRAAEAMICLALYDLEKGGHTTAEFRSAGLPVTNQAIRDWRALSKRATVAEKAGLMEVSRASWFRHYAKPYEALYSDLVGWAYVGRAHVFRMYNIEELT